MCSAMILFKSVFFVEKEFFVFYVFGYLFENNSFDYLANRWQQADWSVACRIGWLLVRLSNKYYFRFFSNVWENF